MERVKINLFDSRLRKWVIATAHKQHWRMPRWMTVDDIVQEGYVCFVKCQKRYRFTHPEWGSDKQQFMAYFKTAFSNRLHTLARKRTETPEIAASAVNLDDEGTVESWQRNAAVLGDASLAALLASAPEEVLDAIKALMGDGRVTGEYIFSKLVGRVLPSGSVRLKLLKQGLRETTEEHVARCLGREGLPDLVRSFLADA